MILFMTLFMISVREDAWAHPGHDDPVTISRSSNVYLQQIIPHYLTIQEGLAAGLFDEAVKYAAKVIKEIMEEATSKEKDPSGKKMFKGVAQAAGFIAASSNIDSSREGFSDLNDKLLPFFNGWPVHISKNGLILYTCKATKQWWLQRNGTPRGPYGYSAETCGELEKKGE